ncbi:MAG TPA: hypothetical protein VMH81_14425 [Bryobacteraceae bacterium]|nr:hypothetical protein [Bryobacteraceae bacterium]
MPGVPLITSAATLSTTSIAPGSLAFALGQGLATGIPGEILGPSPTSFDGTSVSIVDSAGNTAAAPLLFVSPWQVTLPSTVAPGLAQVKITAGGSTQTAANVKIAGVAPSVFTLNGLGLAAASAIRVSGGNQITEPAYALNSAGSFSASPIHMGSGSGQVYLVLFGTGIAPAGTSGTTVTVGGVNAPVLYAGSGGFAGVGQVNVQLPAALAGMGNVNVQLTAGGVAANAAQITVQ